MADTLRTADPAVSSSQSPVSPKVESGRQALSEGAQHAPHLLHFGREPGTRRAGQEPEIPSEKEIILKFVARSQRVEKKPAEVASGTSASTLGNVGRYRLIAKTELAALIEVCGNNVHVRAIWCDLTQTASFLKSRMAPPGIGGEFVQGPG
jgi:hypothetical protein